MSDAISETGDSPAALPRPLADVLAGQYPDRERGASAQVYEILRCAILRLELLPNQPISEHEVASVLGLSRTPVREAIKRLSDEGLVTSYPQLSTVIAPIRISAILESQFMREEVEGALAARAAEVIDAAGKALLRDVMARLTMAWEAGDWRRLHASDDETHRLITEIAGFPGIYRVIEVNRAHMDRLRHVLIPQRETSRHLITQHGAFVEAICNHDATAARAAMVLHTRDILPRLETLRAARPEMFEERTATRARGRGRG